MREGIVGLLRDKTRPARIKRLPQETVARVVALTQEPAPGEPQLEVRRIGHHLLQLGILIFKLLRRRCAIPAVGHLEICVDLQRQPSEGSEASNLLPAT